MLTIIIGVVGSLIASIICAILVAGHRRWWGQQIKITEPAPNAFLAPVEVRRGTGAHRVFGTLNFLPKGHRIWLIVVDETKGRYWPQGFEAVEYHGETGTWSGYITAEGWHSVTVVAVVAPPTTQDYFNYFQRVGHKTSYDPLLGIPQECRKRDTVRCKVPPAPALQVR
jgi:hypothetical protein